MSDVLMVGVLSFSPSVVESTGYDVRVLLPAASHTLTVVSTLLGSGAKNRVTYYIIDRTVRSNISISDIPFLRLPLYASPCSPPQATRYMESITYTSTFPFFLSSSA